MLKIDSQNVKPKKKLWGERHPSGYENDIVYIAELTNKNVAQYSCILNADACQTRMNAGQLATAEWEAEHA